MSDFTAQSCVESLDVYDRRIAEPREKAPAESSKPLRIHPMSMWSHDLCTACPASEQHEPIGLCSTAVHFYAVVTQFDQNPKPQVVEARQVATEQSRIKVLEELVHIICRLAFIPKLACHALVGHGIAVDVMRAWLWRRHCGWRHRRWRWRRLHCGRR